MKRRERTRQLIELGGLVAKSGLVELTDDDRAVLYGLLVEAAAKLNRPDSDKQLVIWRRRGRRAFDDSDGRQVSRLDPSQTPALDEFEL